MKLGLLREDSKVSSIRFHLVLGAIGAFLNMLAVAFYIVKRAYIPEGVTGWTEMGLFLAGVASILTGLAWGKYKQKQIEKSHESKPE